MNAPFEPLLMTTDWNEEWKAFRAVRNRADDASVWDEKAKTFPVKHGSQEGYVKRFLELAGVRPGETVLDMGCGTGSLATPLAMQGVHVIACDFSRGMLDKMRQDQSDLGVTGVDARLMSWADDWALQGLGENAVDVAIASRSIVTDDLQQALLRLDGVARRRVCITLPCGPSPRTDERLLEAVGLGNRRGRDFVYAFNILVANGLNPEIAYIESIRQDVFATFEEARGCYTQMVLDAVRGLATPEEVACVPQRMDAWLHDNLVHVEDGYRLSQDRSVVWAFIAWAPRT